MKEGLSLFKSLSMKVHPSQSRLMGLGNRLLFINPLIGLVDIGQEFPLTEDLQPWRRVPLNFDSITPAYDQQPTVASSRGTIFCWMSNNEIRILKQGVRGSFVADRIAEKQLVLRFMGEGNRKMVSYDLETEKVLWERQGLPLAFLPAPGNLLVIEQLGVGPLLCLDSLTGVEKWRFSIPKIIDLLGVVGEKIWISVKGLGLVAVNIHSAEKAGMINLPDISVPRGVIDDRAYIHLCNGIRYIMASLNDEGEVLTATEFEQRPEGPGMASGIHALPIKDGRLIFFDQDNNIFEVSPHKPGHPNRIWHAGSQIVSIGIANESLYVLEKSGLFLQFG
ncbi:MAG: hypothetical protein KDD02_22440 [Phaeodactylibacter sp.]|nr:hypothetical protein [Phaeodactylibacter sp.]